MEQDGYLVHTNQTVGGKVRKYYSITEQGQQALVEARQKIRELVDEVIQETGGEQSTPGAPESFKSTSGKRGRKTAKN